MLLFSIQEDITVINSTIYFYVLDIEKNIT